MQASIISQKKINQCLELLITRWRACSLLSSICDSRSHFAFHLFDVCHCIENERENWIRVRTISWSLELRNYIALPSSRNANRVLWTIMAERNFGISIIKVSKRNRNGNSTLVAMVFPDTQKAFFSLDLLNSFINFHLKGFTKKNTYSIFVHLSIRIMPNVCHLWLPGFSRGQTVHPTKKKFTCSSKSKHLNSYTS